MEGRGGGRLWKTSSTLFQASSTLFCRRCRLVGAGVVGPFDKPVLVVITPPLAIVCMSSSHLL